jgi:arylsulfatase A-like enzyme
MLSSRTRWRILLVVVPGVAVLAATIIIANAWLGFGASARELIERHTRILQRAGPSYERETLASLEANPHNGAFHRLDEILAQATEREAPAEVGASVEDVLLGVELDGSAPLLVPVDGASAPAGAEGWVTLPRQSGSFLTNRSPLDVPKDDVGKIAIRARTRTPVRLELGWSRSFETPRPWRHRLGIDLVGDGKPRTYEIDARNALKRGLTAGDRIARVFLRVVRPEAAHVEIDFIRFVSKRAAYREKRGVVYETVGAEVRPGVFMRTPQVIAYSLDIPATEPRLRFGMATLDPEIPVTFRVQVSGEEVFRETVQRSDSWLDAEVDLTPWAGHEQELALAMDAAGDNVAFWSSPRVRSAPRKRFNIIVILEDGLRVDHLSTHGYERPTSPWRADFMQRRGVVFERAIAQATKTRPSVPSLMTSLLPSQTGVLGWSDALDPAFLTLAEVLRAQGYVTASFVQNGNAGPYAGLHQGFDVLRDEETLGHATTDILDAALEWIERHLDSNFFLYLHVADPHGVYDPPPPFDRWYRDLALDESTSVERSYLDPGWVDRPTAEGRIALYDGEIANNDRALRGFVERLEALGLVDDALILLTSDHGEYLGEYGIWEHHPPGRMQVIGVPLMFTYPERFANPVRVPHVVQLLDVMPTVLELAGVNPQRLAVAGDSLVDLVEGRDAGKWRDRLTVSEEPTAMRRGAPSGLGSLFHKRWQLMASSGFEVDPVIGRTRVFAWGPRPSTMRASRAPIPNLLAGFRLRGVLEELQSINIDSRRRWTAQGEDDVLEVDPEVLERLRGLGYVNH